MGIDIDIGIDISKYVGNEDGDGMRMTWGGTRKSKVEKALKFSGGLPTHESWAEQRGSELPSPRGFQ